MDISDIVRRSWQEFEPELAEQGYELVEVEYGMQGGSAVLRLFIDKSEGVTLDDCQRVSHLVSALLDRSDFVSGHYMLEVSSPGFDRPVRKASDFERFAGEKIALTALTAIAGRKQFRGILKGFRDGLVLVECAGTEHGIHIENLKKARLDR